MAFTSCVHRVNGQYDIRRYADLGTWKRISLWNDVLCYRKRISLWNDVIMLQKACIIVKWCPLLPKACIIVKWCHVLCTASIIVKWCPVLTEEECCEENTPSPPETPAHDSSGPPQPADGTTSAYSSAAGQTVTEPSTAETTLPPVSLREEKAWDIEVGRQHYISRFITSLNSWRIVLVTMVTQLTYQTLWWLVVSTLCKTF